MTPTAAELMQRHFDTLFADPPTWRTLIADDLLWELPFAPSIGHPAKLEGRDEVTAFVGAFVDAMEEFTLLTPSIRSINNTAAVAEVAGVGRCRPTGRNYEQSYVVFLDARDGRISRIREYFNPATAARALGLPILELAT